MVQKSRSYYDEPRGGLESLRQEVIDRLTEAFSADDISMEEYERRATEANSALKITELERIYDSLPARQTKPGKPLDTRNSGIMGAPSITTGSIMSDKRMTGNWLSSDRVSSFTFMGSTRLDLRDVDLPPGPIHIEAFTLMGETRVIVPRGLPVRLNVFAFMGESKASRDVNQQVKGATSWVEISGFAMMGSVSVKAMD